MTENDIILRNIIKKCKRGDMNAFDRLMSEYQAPVFGYAYKLCQNYEDANDITNETFIRVLESIKNFDMDGHFKGWLLKIVKNIYIDRFRSEKKRKYVSIDGDEENRAVEIVDETPNPMLQLLDEEKKQILRDMIDSFPEIHRQPLKLFYIEGKSYKQISEELGISMGTTKSRINRGMEMLRNKFINEYAERELPEKHIKSLPSPEKK